MPRGASRKAAVVALCLALGLTAQPASSHGRRSLRHHRRATSALEQSPTMKSSYPYYHTSDEIHDELVRLSKSCSYLSLETKEGAEVNIDVVSVKKGSPTNKNFLLFGEHSRELISPESSLHFIRTLCGEVPELSAKAEKTLADAEFKIVVNGNPNSRRKVESGDFCLRVNENGVDLNRNWDEKWQTSADLDPADTNPGPAAFSEAETKIFKDLVTEYRPTNFLTVHSGTMGMYMPWAFDMEHLADRNQKAMMTMLTSLDKGHCQCPFGAAGREVGYSCPGTCLDYVYDQLKTPFVFAFEIYTSPDQQGELRDRWQEKYAQYQADTKGVSAATDKAADKAAGDAQDEVEAEADLVQLSHPSLKEVFDFHPSSFVQTRASSKKARDFRDPSACLEQFNPVSQDEYDTTVNNWSDAYLDLAQMVTAKVAAGGVE